MTTQKKPVQTIVQSIAGFKTYIRDQTASGEPVLTFFSKSYQHLTADQRIDLSHKLIDNIPNAKKVTWCNSDSLVTKPSLIIELTSW
jgi:hypothetical protein